jgi:hypothetical protein
VAAVEKRHQPGVLRLVVFDDQARLGVIGVHGSVARRPPRPGSPISQPPFLRLGRPFIPQPPVSLLFHPWSQISTRR